VKCFYHRDVDAIGLCKACSKGLCGTCAVDVGSGLACRESCVELVRNINELVERNIRISPASEQLLGKQPRVYLVTGVFAMLGGILFIVLGQGMDGIFRMGVTGIGALAVLLGVWQGLFGWRLRHRSTGAR
jgi:hypothetical protein